MKDKLYILLSVALLFTACAQDETVGGQEKGKIEIMFTVPAFSIERMDGTGGVRSTRATDVGSTAEQQVSNLYLFLFKEDGTDPVTYYIDNTGNFNDGSTGTLAGNWNSTSNKVSLELTQAQAGSRRVYIVANCDVSLKNKLDKVTSISGNGETALESVLSEASTPWSSTLTTPILMSGSAPLHNFITNSRLNNVVLIRAVAKLQLNITLTAPRQGAPTLSEGIAGNATTVHPYGYKFINFDKNMYLFKPASKSDNLLTSPDWVNWNASGVPSSYSLDGAGKVTALTLNTYLNERDNTGTAVELQLPYYAGGKLPPPEFGGESYKITLPEKVERNHWYVYDVEI